MFDVCIQQHGHVNGKLFEASGVYVKKKKQQMIFYFTIYFLQSCEFGETDIKVFGDISVIFSMFLSIAYASASELAIDSPVMYLQYSEKKKTDYENNIRMNE